MTSELHATSEKVMHAVETLREFAQAQGLPLQSRMETHPQ
jgi:hypothetical protein